MLGLAGILIGLLGESTHLIGGCKLSGSALITKANRYRNREEIPSPQLKVQAVIEFLPSTRL